MTSILADHEFELIRPWFPYINTTAAGEHVSEIERYIRTVKDRTRSTYTVLPFKRLPSRTMLVHLVKNTVFWLNAFTTDDGISRVHSPRYIITGHALSKKNALLEFVSYVQTHEVHTSDRSQCTSMGCICLGPPTGNQQGGHWFMSLTSGERVVRYR